MIKTKVFYFHIDDRHSADSEVQQFLDNLFLDGHTFINLNTLVYGIGQGYRNRFRTEIIYRENSTRKVITEKHGEE